MVFQRGKHLYAFLRSDIPHSTFHYLAIQTIRWFRQSDRKPMELPFRLKELRTFATFPLSQHRGFYFPPPANGWRSPFLSRTGNVLHASVNQLSHACLLTKWKKCNILSLFLQIHIVESTIPRRSSVPLSLQKGAAYGMLPICKAFVCLPFYKRLFHIPLQSSWGGTRPLSVSSSSILSFIQTYNILLSTSRQQRPGCQ